MRSFKERRCRNSRVRQIDRYRKWFLDGYNLLIIIIALCKSIEQWFHCCCSGTWFDEMMAVTFRPPIFVYCTIPQPMLVTCAMSFDETWWDTLFCALWYMLLVSHGYETRVSKAHNCCNQFALSSAQWPSPCQIMYLSSNSETTALSICIALYCQVDIRPEVHTIGSMFCNSYHICCIHVRLGRLSYNTFH